jgi:hypothetical protein
MWLRILEISAGLIIFILGVAAFYPGVDWGWTTFLAFLVITLIVLEIAYIIRIFAKGISGRRRFNLILSVLAILIAVLVLATLFFYGSFLSLISTLALGVLFAGIASAVRGTVGSKIVGIFGIFVGIIAILINFGLSISRDLTYPENVAALITLSLIIFGLEPIISGIIGRWT